MDTYGDAPDANATLNLFWTARVVAGEPVAADDVSELRWFAAGRAPGHRTSSRSTFCRRCFGPGRRRERRLPLRRRQHAARQRPRRRRSAGSPRDRGRRPMRPPVLGDLRGAAGRARVRRLPRRPAALPRASGRATSGSSTVSHYLISYPFANRLFPGSLDALDHARSIGTAAILTDGDVVFQPRKIWRSGLTTRSAGACSSTSTRSTSSTTCAERLPADHYVLVDDKVRILDRRQGSLGARVTTVSPRQGPLRARRRRVCALPAPPTSRSSGSAISSSTISTGSSRQPRPTPETRDEPAPGPAPRRG